MMKLKRCKLRLKEQRHYAEYLKCKLAKKAMQNQKLKERLWKNNCGMADRDAEIRRLNATIDRTVNAWESRCIEKYDQLTAHSDIERQDDKSSNDTQKEIFVYGKEDSEAQQ